MQIKYLGGQDFEIKTKSALISLSESVAIDGFVLPGPGEYEKSGVIVHGVQDENNTIYTIRTEEMNLCYLGCLSRALDENEIKEIGDVDILFLPLGDKGSISVKVALGVLSKIDPYCVIPMLYTDSTEFKSSENAEEVDVLKIKKSDLPQEGRNAYILSN